MAEVAARDPPATPCLHGGRGGGQVTLQMEASGSPLLKKGEK
jgi:hypothetical protein